MGNRAVITTKERKIGLYLHWNGGRDTVEPVLGTAEPGDGGREQQPPRGEGERHGSPHRLARLE